MKTTALVLLALTILLPTVPSLSGTQNRVVDLASVREPLKKAKYDVAHMPGGWGGHMEAAANHIEAALKELDEAEKYAREHGEMK